jgi:hypothetical protein
MISGAGGQQQQAAAAGTTSWAAAAGKGLPPSEPSPGQMNGATNKQLEQLNSVREALFSQVRSRLGVFSGVSEPDPYWIRIQSGQWIRIRIRNPDPGGQK